MKLDVIPLNRAEANAYVVEHHRHAKAVVGHKFALGATERGSSHVLGVVIVGRTTARHLDDGWTLEVTRLATDGSANVCSFLYGAAWRAARSLGYRRLVTYTRVSEPGTTLRAAGWRDVGRVRAERWHRRERPRVETEPLFAKVRWEIAS